MSGKLKKRRFFRSIWLILALSSLCLLAFWKTLETSVEDVLSYYAQLPEDEKNLPLETTQIIIRLFGGSVQEEVSHLQCLLENIGSRVTLLMRNKDYQGYTSASCPGVSSLTSTIVVEFERKNDAKYRIFYSEMKADAIEKKLTETQQAALFAHFFSSEKSLNQASLESFGRPLSELIPQELINLIAQEEVGQLDVKNLEGEVFIEEIISQHRRKIDDRVEMYTYILQDRALSPTP